ncbi:hypothetical protein ACFLWH_00485 [Chloroflexota bacterium]
MHLEKASSGAVGLSGYNGEVGFSYAIYTLLINSFPMAKFEDATNIVEDDRKIKLFDMPINHPIWVGK